MNTFYVRQSTYDSARNIRMNAQKGRRAVWMKLEGAVRVNEFLFQFGEFSPSYGEDGRYAAQHPVVKAAHGNDFYHAMQDNIMTYGGLTEKQNEAVLAMIARAEVKVAGYAEKAAKSNWIGTVGERRAFSLTVRHVVTLDGIYGTSYLHIMEDIDGNVVIYKGTKLYEGFVIIKATIKEHGERDGVKQTKIARPA